LGEGDSMEEGQGVGGTQTQRSLISAARQLLAAVDSTTTTSSNSSGGAGKKISATQATALRSLFASIDQLFLALCRGGPIGIVDEVCRLLLPSTQAGSSGTKAGGGVKGKVGLTPSLAADDRSGSGSSGGFVGFQNARDVLASFEGEEPRENGTSGVSDGGDSDSADHRPDSLKTSVARDHLSLFRALCTKASASNSNVDIPNKSASNSVNNSVAAAATVSARTTMGDEELMALLARCEVEELTNLLDALATLAEEGGGVEEKGGGGAVTVGTIHASKGLEYVK
jgi:hypothetical protein